MTGIFATAVLVADICTFILLAAQFRASGRTWVMVLASAYLYSGLMALLHVLTFPSAFVEDAPLIGSRQTVGWLYVFWNVGFAGLMLATVLYAMRSPARRMHFTKHRQEEWAMIAGVFAIVGLLLVVTTAGVQILPAITTGDRFGPLSIAMNSLRAGLALTALALLWLTRSGRTIILVWMTLALVAAAAGPLLTDLGGSRYTFGWYAGRASFVFASYVILAVLLTEFAKLQKVLAGMVDQLKNQTENLYAEIQRREIAERKLVQGQKMEAIGQLAGGVAHDFNNLLLVVTANVEMILRTADDERVRQCAQQAKQAALRGGRLTHSLLAFGRRQPLQLRLVKTDELLDGFRMLLQRAVGDLVNVEVRSAPDLWACKADQSQLEIALLNLALNARDAMPKGGSLRIESRNFTLAKHAAPMDLDLDVGDYVAISVSDSGLGIPLSCIDRVFEPFFTTKEIGKGNGLGLSQVQGFAKQSGGDVRLESAEGMGTTITIYLPRATSESNVRDAERQNGPTALGAKDQMYG